MRHAANSRLKSREGEDCATNEWRRQRANRMHRTRVEDNERTGPSEYAHGAARDDVAPNETQEQRANEVHRMRRVASG